jgi:hypothetical protein
VPARRAAVTDRPHDGRRIRSRHRTSPPNPSQPRSPGQPTAQPGTTADRCSPTAARRPPLADRPATPADPPRPLTHRPRRARRPADPAGRPALADSAGLADRTRRPGWAANVPTQSGYRLRPTWAELANLAGLPDRLAAGLAWFPGCQPSWAVNLAGLPGCLGLQGVGLLRGGCSVRRTNETG